MNGFLFLPTRIETQFRERLLAKCGATCGEGLCGAVFHVALPVARAVLGANYSQQLMTLFGKPPEWKSSNPDGFVYTLRPCQRESRTGDLAVFRVLKRACAAYRALLPDLRADAGRLRYGVVEFMSEIIGSCPFGRTVCINRCRECVTHRSKKNSNKRICSRRSNDRHRMAKIMVRTVITSPARLHLFCCACPSILKPYKPPDRVSIETPRHPSTMSETASNGYSTES
jgi:hypothetical protein